ncbi:hypothetical protein, partial [Merdimonas faecis]
MKRNKRIWSMLLTLVMVLSVSVPANAQENIPANSQTNVEDSVEGNQGDTGEVSDSADQSGNVPSEGVSEETPGNDVQQSETDEETEQD